MKPRNKEKKTNEKFRQRIIKSPKKKKKKKTREKITVYKLIVNKLKFSDFSFKLT